MDIESLFTIRIVSDSAPETNFPGAVQDSEELQQQSFIDLFLAQVVPSADTSQQDNEEPKLLQSENPLLEEKPKLDITRLLSENEEVSAAAEGYAEITGEDIPQILALNQQTFDEIIKPLQEQIALALESSELEEGIPVQELDLQKLLFIEDQEHEFADKIKVIVGKLEALSKENGPQLIATNLTPEDITELQDYAYELYIAEETAKSTTGAEPAFAPEQLDDVGIAVVSLVAPSVIKDAQSKTPVAEKAPIETTTGPAPATRSPVTSTPASLNAIEPGGLNNQPPTMNNAANPDAEFSETAKEVTKAPVKGEAAEVKADRATPPAATPNTNNAAPQTVNFENLLSQLNIFSNYAGTTADLISPEAGGAQITGLQNLTSAVTQVQQASQPHPTTQIVAAMVQNAGVKGKDTQISVQLDPPDLGRINVDMRFGKDKQVKAILTIEKPETLAMLQRDVHTLERALQEIGLDTSGDSLSFDLADQGYDFNHNGQHDGSGPSGSGNAEDGETELTLIETDLDWYIDPDTGHTHYSILA